MSTELTANLSTNDIILSPQGMTNISQFAEFMSTAQVMIPDHLRGKPADCAAIVMQSLQWGMNPYSVAQKTHLVSGTLGYEAQLVNAVISSSTAIQGRFKYEYSQHAEGEGWDALADLVEIRAVKKNGRKGEYTVDQPVKLWDKSHEKGLWIKVGAVLAGEDEITWGEKLFLSQVLTRNSPLWVTAPKQQIAYLDVKYWSRLNTPDIILGVYTIDEIPAQGFENAKNVTPPKDSDGKPESAIRRPDADQVTEAEEGETIDQAADTEPEEVKLIPVGDILESMVKCDTIELLDVVRADAEKYPGGEDRDQLIQGYKDHKARILLAEDAAKLKAKEAAQ